MDWHDNGEKIIRSVSGDSTHAVLFPVSMCHKEAHGTHKDGTQYTVEYNAHFYSRQTRSDQLIISHLI